MQAQRYPFTRPDKTNATVELHPHGFGMGGGEQTVHLPYNLPTKTTEMLHLNVHKDKENQQQYFWHGNICGSPDVV